MSYLVTSGYTLKSPYFNDALGLYKSCMKHGVYSEVIPYRSFGTWRANANYKGSLVEFAMKRQPFNGVDIVWIDADALVLKPPVLFDDYPYDIGVYFVDWLGKRTCSNGTIFFRNCPEVLEFVKDWAKWGLAHPKESQQDYFGKALETSGLNWGELPPEYCMVVAPDPLPENFKPYITKPGPIRDDVSIDDVVILHTWGGKRHEKIQRFK